MLFSSDRDQLRDSYFQAWEKKKNSQPLTPLEAQIASVIEIHPEYHRLMDVKEEQKYKDYLPELGEVNPFLHMGLHLGVREQVSTNRPKNMKKFFMAALPHFQTEHDTEHFFMDILAEMMWQSQRDQKPTTDAEYIKKLKKAFKKMNISI